MLTVTHAGRNGDIFWAGPALRAIAAVHGPVHLHVPGEFARVGPIMSQQPYIAEFSSDPEWSPLPGDSPNPLIHPWKAPKYPDAIHIGYRGWPTMALPHEAHRIACSQTSVGPLDLSPWIIVEPFDLCPVVVGWTETWFELKLGLTLLLNEQWSMSILVPEHGRWDTDAPVPISSSIQGSDFLFAASCIAGAKVFLGDCSALHVLAVAIGTPCVIVEPMGSRLNDIFWAVGMDGPRVHCVKGMDGLPTTDVRHTADKLREVLAGVTV